MSPKNRSVPPATAKLVSILLGAALLIMLASSLWQRIQNPSLLRQAQAPLASAEEAAQQENLVRISTLMQQVKKNPHDVEALNALAEHFISHESWDEALSFAQRASEAAPKNPRPLYLSGVILHKQSKHAEAAAALEKVLTLHNDPAARYSLAVLYIHFLGQAEKGLAQARAGLADPQSSPELKALFQNEIDNSAKHGK